MKHMRKIAVAILLTASGGSSAQVAQSFRQIEHSKQFSSYGSKDSKLTDSPGDAEFFLHSETSLHSTVPSRSEFFANLACQSGAVVLGKVVSQTGVLTPDETFIFTEAEISVVETLKDNPGSHIYPNQTITVTRPGGSVQWNGRKMSFKITHFRDFLVGHQYLLFLRFMATTFDYEAFWDRTFELRDGLIFNLHDRLLWDGQQATKQDASTALADARRAVAASCK